VHIPDGFLDTKTWVTAAAVSGIIVAYAAKKVKEELGEKQIPLMGVMAAFIFAAQMINFPVAGGTSGHFVGAALAAIFLGPWAAALLMTTILLVQALLFADGGITALGANILNMGILAPFAAYWIYTSIKNIFTGRAGMMTGAFLASWFSVFISAAACALELAASGIVPVGVALPAMAGWHALIGLGEGLITATVITFVLQVRPDLFKIAPRPDHKVIVAGLLIALFLAGILSPFASTFPDGLERVAVDLGFLKRGEGKPLVSSPLPDYAVPGIKSELLATASAGVVGTLVTLMAVYGLTLVVRRRKEDNA